MGFKNIVSKRSAIRTSNDAVTTAANLTLRQSLLPLALVTSLFFLWGFSYGLLDTLNKHFQQTLNITRTRSSGLQAAYFGAYPLASLGYANWILRHYGYKAVFIFGLCTYAIGALMMWPAGVYKSFGGFCGATFICGSGLGSLETAANPYLAAFNGIGSVVAPALASYVFFKNTGDSVNSLKNVQWVYLAVAAFALCLAAIMFVAHIPEVTDADMELQLKETNSKSSDAPFRKQYRLFHASFAQFCYCGAQVAVATWFINYVVETRSGSTTSLASNLLAGAQGAFTVGRFSGVLLMRFVRPRIVFLAYICGVVIFLAAASGSRQNTGIAMLFLTLFFESVCFPTIVALGIRGLGRHYKRGSGFIVGGVIGGACVPALTGKVADMHNNTGIAMAVPVVFMVAASSYAACVNFVPSYREVCDQIGGSRVTVVDTSDPERIGSMKEAQGMDGAQVLEVEKLQAMGKE